MQNGALDNKHLSPQSTIRSLSYFSSLLTAVGCLTLQAGAGDVGTCQIGLAPVSPDTLTG
jgi:hypothetical protein